MIKSFRLQLTAWYLLFFTLLFMLFSIFLYQVLARALHKRMDETLSSELNTAVGMLGDEMAELKGDTHRAAQEARRNGTKYAKMTVERHGSHELVR